MRRGIYGGTRRNAERCGKMRTDADDSSFKGAMSTVECQNLKIAPNFFSRSKLAPKDKYRVKGQNIQAF